MSAPRLSELRIAVVGGGIAGLTIGLAAAREGAEVLLLEVAQGPRTGGYMLDFFGPGFDAAETMGLRSALGGIHYPVQHLRFVDGAGTTTVSVAYPALRRRVFGDRHFNFLRGDIERVLFERARDVVELRFGTTIEKIDAHDGGCDVTCSDGSAHTVDLVVGADGVHSGVRAQCFGPEDRFRRDLGHATGALMLDRAPAGAPPRDFTTLSVPGRMVAVYPVPGGGAAAFFAHRTDDASGEVTRGAHAVLPEVYGDLGWVVPEILDAVARSDDVCFDTVSQIRAPAWTRGRVVLAGDAAWCVSLMAGQGASLALAGGKDLIDALAAGPDVDAAVRTWETRLRGPVEKAQARGRRTANWFVPPDRAHLVIRDWITRAMAWPVIGGLIGRGIGGGRSAT